VACGGASTWQPASSPDPPILLLDEPTTGLDPRSRLGMWDVLTELVNDGATLLLTTQYLEEATGWRTPSSSSTTGR
jgi:energy-coupling factor transporter ATP-binding protein EcfA2